MLLGFLQMKNWAQKPRYICSVNTQFVNPNMLFFLAGEAFSPAEFCIQNFEELWLQDVQNSVRFWLSDAQELEVKTSGSTGEPKVIYIARSVLYNSALATLQAFKLEPKNSALLFLPCSFIGGKMMVFRALLGGLHVHLLQPKALLPVLSQSYDFVALTPLQAFNSVVELEHFTIVLLGGAPVDAGLQAKLNTLKTAVYHSYGMTETASHIALRKINGADASPEFVALAGVHFSQDARGCLVIDAPNWNAKNLITNDVVNLIDSRHFVWKGRADNVINSGGLKIFPEEIEQKLEEQMQQPFFVGSLPDAEFGQKLVLFVEGELKSVPNFSALPKAHQPKKIVALPLFVYTVTDKIDRTKTMALAKSA